MPLEGKQNDTVFGGPVLWVLMYLNEDRGKNGGTERERDRDIERERAREREFYCLLI